MKWQTVEEIIWIGMVIAIAFAIIFCGRAQNRKDLTPTVNQRIVNE